MPIMDDRFTNVFAGEITLDSADTEKFLEISTGVSLAQKLGIVIDHIDMYPNGASIGALEADNDVLLMALVTSNQLTDLQDLSDRRILALQVLQGQAAGTAGTNNIIHLPLRMSFAPPMIVASPRMYFAVDSAGLGVAATVRMRLYYRFVSLSAQEYLEIAETFQLTS